MDVVEVESPIEDHQANGEVERANVEFSGRQGLLNDHLIHILIGLHQPIILFMHGWSTMPVLSTYAFKFA